MKMALVTLYTTFAARSLAPAGVLLRHLTQMATATKTPTLMDWPEARTEDKMVYQAFRSSIEKTSANPVNGFATTRITIPSSKFTTHSTLRKMNDAVLGRRNLHTAPHRKPESDSESVSLYKRPEESRTQEDLEVRNAFLQSVGATPQAAQYSRPITPDCSIRTAFKKSVETIRQENRTVYTKTE